MSALADAVLDNLGDIIGVIPRTLVEREVANTALTAASPRARSARLRRASNSGRLADAALYALRAWSISSPSFLC